MPCRPAAGREKGFRRNGARDGRSGIARCGGIRLHAAFDGGDDTRVFCLFCETQRCRDIAAFVEKVHGFRCVFPRVIQRKWVRGKMTEESHAWLPGYLFLYTEEAVLPPLEPAGIIRVLGGGELKGRDRDFAEMLYRVNGVLGTVRLAEVGDRCHVADPLWENLHGTIVKIDRGRKRCCVEYVFDRVKRSVWVGYEMVKTENEDTDEEN